MGSFKHFEEWRRRPPGKIATPLSEKLEAAKWGDFRLGDLFEIDRGDISKQENLIEDSAGIVFVAQNNSNNGFSQRVEPQKYKQFPEGSLAVGRQTGAVYYQDDRFITTDGVLVLTSADGSKISKYFGLILVSTIRMHMYSYGYNNTVSASKLREIIIKLPILPNGKIDFAFIDDFVKELEVDRVKELEVDRVKELEAYLSVTGLDDYTLTEAEQRAIDELESLSTESIKLVDLCDIKNTYSILSRDIIPESGDVPYLTAGTDNNAISTYISYNQEFLDEGNCVFIGGKTLAVTYQDRDFFSNDSHNLALYIKDHTKRVRPIQLYLASSVDSGLRGKYSWGDSISRSKIQYDSVSLPLKNDRPDYAYMETLISAVQKLVIKDVVNFADQKIAATKQVIKT